MARFKIVNGVRLEMSAEEQSAFEAEEVNGEARKVAREEAIAGMEIKTEKVSELPLYHGVVE